MTSTRKEFNEPLEARMITPSSSSCSFPVEVAAKKDGRPLFFVYYLKVKRMMNKQCWRPPKIQEHLDEIPGVKVLKTLNVYMGHQ